MNFYIDVFFFLLLVGSIVIFNTFGNVIFGIFVPLTMITITTVLFGPGLKNIFLKYLK